MKMKRTELLIILCSIFLMFVSVSTSSADEKSHYKVASQVVDLTFNAEAYYNNAMKYALLAIKDRYEQNPKTKPYSDILINAIMEVMESYVNNPATLTKVKNISSQIYMDELSESELKELAKFYQTKAGKKIVRKIPVIIQKQWELESQLSLPPEYEQMILDKVSILRKQGKLPESFK